MKRILVSGHRGFIGSHLFPTLQNAVGLDLKDGNDILTCDLPEADVVIHMAAQPGVITSMENPFLTVKQNVLATVRLLQCYPDARFIFTSTGGAIQETIESPYGLSKYHCEQYIQMLHKNYVILRLPNVYGKNSRSVADKFLNGDITIYGDGSANRTYGHVNDVTHAIRQAFDWPVGKYHLGSDQNYTVLEIAYAIGKKPIVFLPPRKGELAHSSLQNTTPNWHATVDLMDYIQSFKV